MPQQRIYHEYVNGELVPFWYVLTFQPGEIEWEADAYYFTPIQPFHFEERDQFDDSFVSASLYLEDLLTVERLGQIGINLNRVKKRIDRYGAEPSLVRQFIVQMPDIEDVVQLLPARREQSFIMAR
ncbi:hypothetical protein FZC84_12105 [Rossellomorea vietnamensis]|uniref:Uncharacterized protein n=1 Tax=Rossellomorea vietnamensis TaxID=218284 RepID=A0A5D4MBX0_9BACI|nr:hypothetical protein [Rossellomorea vietnamensis]TYR99111.1 hypothetical protein FZC84_12105 [Rossellomorea vietnamensis]